MKKLLFFLSFFLFALAASAQEEETIQVLQPHPLDTNKLAVVTTTTDTTTGTYIVQYSTPKDSATIQLEMFQQIEARKTELAQYKNLSYRSEKEVNRFTKLANSISNDSYNDYIKEKLKPILKGNYVLTINKEKIQATVNNNLRIRETDGDRRWTIVPDSPYQLTISQTNSSLKYNLIKTSQQPEIWRLVEGEDSLVRKMILRKK